MVIWFYIFFKHEYNLTTDYRVKPVLENHKDNVII